MTEPDKLLAVGLNAAWQKILVFKDLHRGQVNRAEAVITQTGGKGVNCASAVFTAGGRAVVAQFTGGQTGDWIRADLRRRGIPDLTVAVAAPTRVCTTLVSDADGSATELIEPSGTVTPAECAALRDQVLAMLPDVRGVSLCGTFPPGVPATLYAEIAAAARPRALVLLDACRSVEPTLQAGIDVLKINAAELRLLTGCADMPAAARLLAQRYGPLWIAVTAGPDAAFLFGAGGAWRFALPPLTGVRNPIGAGDTTAGVFLWHLTKARGADLPASRLVPEAVIAAYKEALAAASASCLTLTPAAFDPAVATDLRSRIMVTPLHEN